MAFGKLDKLMEIGKMIAALRKERGMTQEQLGKALGVSAQAVSKWEKGGAPDVQLLPSIADRLGVTVDTLFGRADEPALDMRAALLRWLSAFPQQKRIDELFRLLCCTFMSPMEDAMIGEFMDLYRLPVRTCYSADSANHAEESNWLRSSIISETGLQLAVPAEDFPMFLLMPEPEGGYEVNFVENDRYRSLFSALALPGSLEILRTLFSRKQRYYSAAAIARASGVSKEETERALPALAECNILAKSTVELEDAPIEVYTLHGQDAFVPFMLFSRWMCDRDDAYFCCWRDREDPLLRRKGETPAKTD